MKHLLFVYDSMMTGGTTTALLSLLYGLDYSQYTVDLLLFENSGAYLLDVPKQVHLLQPALKPSRVGRMTVSQRKIIRTVFNGGLIKSLFAFKKYRATPKGNLRNILMHYAVTAQVSISRSVSKQYDAAIAFMEGWSAHYVLSPKISADMRIVWIHPDYKDSYLIPEMDKGAFGKADAIVTVSSRCQLNMQAFFPQYKDRIQVIENITLPELFVVRAQEIEVCIDRSVFNMCTVCRCDMDVKGLDRMINVISRLRNDGTFENVKWHLIGNGKDFSKIQKMVLDRKLGDCIELHGMKKNPLPYLKEMDLFVLPSRYEGKPVSVTEALCLGVPCVVTNYASAHEQIKSGVNGLVSDNSEEGLYNALKRVLDDRDYLAVLQEGARKSDYNNADEMKKLYEILRSSK